MPGEGMLSSYSHSQLIYICLLFVYLFICLYHEYERTNIKKMCYAQLHASKWKCGISIYGYTDRIPIGSPQIAEATPAVKNVCGSRESHNLQTVSPQDLRTARES